MEDKKYDEIIERIMKKQDEIVKIYTAIDNKISKYMGIKKKNSAKEFFVQDYTPELYPYLKGNTLEEKFLDGLTNHKEKFVKDLKSRNN